MEGKKKAMWSVGGGGGFGEGFERFFLFILFTKMPMVMFSESILVVRKSVLT
jgi:hypothetical protein